MVGTLLFAALAAHIDLPRLRLNTSMGDTLNAIRVSDFVSHIKLSRLASRLANDAALQTQLEEGRESLELIAHTPVVLAIVPPNVIPNLDSIAPPREFDNDSPELLELTGLAGQFLNIDLPPPREQALFQPPLLEAPLTLRFNLTARAPPISPR